MNKHIKYYIKIDYVENCKSPRSHIDSQPYNRNDMNWMGRCGRILKAGSSK